MPPRKTNTRSSSPLYWSAESWAIITLRLFLSLRFIVAGIGKFKGEEGFAFSNYYHGTVPWLMNTFDGVLPRFLVAPYAYMIAYIEVVLGIALLLGVKTKYALALTALTYVSLAFGQMLLSEHGTVTNIGIHLIITAAALYFVRHNKLEALR